MKYWCHALACIAATAIVWPKQ